MKILLTLLIMFGSIFGLFLYYFVFSLFLRDRDINLVVYYGSMFLGLVVIFVLAFLQIYNSL